MGGPAAGHWVGAMGRGGEEVKERYVPIRPGIMEHLLRGDISALEFGVYVMVHLQADFSTGIWRGSAPRILNSAPRGADLRQVQRAIEHLSKIGLLKAFSVQGKRGNYPVLINKFTVRSGALSGMRLNASKSLSWQHPVYEPCADSDAESDAQDAPSQEVRSKEGRKNPPVSATPAADSLDSETRGAAFDVFWETWPRKQGKAQALRAWAKIPLAEYGPILAGLERWKRSEQWGRGIIPHPGTWLNEKRWQDEDIPQQVSGKGNGNGKPSVSDNMRTTLAAFRATEQKPVN
jgi:hypothetical protein